MIIRLHFSSEFKTFVISRIKIRLIDFSDFRNNIIQCKNDRLNCSSAGVEIFRIIKMSFIHLSLNFYCLKNKLLSPDSCCETYDVQGKQEEVQLSYTILYYACIIFT